MNASLPTYVDFHRFSGGNQNRDLLGNPMWQRNVKLLVASIEKNLLLRARATKPARRP
jgi:hypothetical protein